MYRSLENPLKVSCRYRTLRPSGGFQGTSLGYRVPAERKLNISLVSTAQSYYAEPKNIRQNSTHYFIMKIRNKQDLQQITFNHSPDNDFKDYEFFQKMYCKPYFFID